MKKQGLSCCCCFFLLFWCFLRSGAFRKGPGPIPEAPWTLPDQILVHFARWFAIDFMRFVDSSAGIMSGFAGMFNAGIHRQPPGPTLRGSPWDTAISGSDSNNIDVTII